MKYAPSIWGFSPKIKLFLKVAAVLLFASGLIFTVRTFINLKSMDPRSSASVGSFVSDGSNSKLEYFGYYHFLGADPNEFLQLAGHANTILVPDIEQIKIASTRGLNSVYIGTRFFWKSDTNNPGKLVLKDNWKNGWNPILQDLIYKGQSNNIIALYIADEPDLFLTNPQDLQTVAEYVRQTLNAKNLQGIKLMTVLSPSGPERLYNQSFSLPNQIDWVGFNEYNCFADSECSRGISYQDKLDWIADYQKSRSKQVFVILNGISTPPPTPVYQEKINDYNRKIFGACLSRMTNCIGVFTFFHDGQYGGMYGSGSMPLIQDTLKFIGGKIKFKNIHDLNLLGGNIAFSKPVRASNTHSSSSTAFINDYNVNTVWNAGGFGFAMGRN